MEEDERYAKHYELLKRFRSTVDGLLSSGRSDVWSTYGGLRRTREMISLILCHGLRDEMDQKMLKYFFDKKNKRSGENKRGTEDDPWVLEQIIEESLLGYCMSAVIGECFVCFDDAIATIYQDFAFVRQQPCVSLLVMCLNALEQNNLEILSSVNKQLLSKRTFMEYIKEEQEGSSDLKTIATSFTSTQQSSPPSENTKEDIYFSSDSLGSPLPAEENQITSKANEFETIGHSQNEEYARISTPKRKNLHQDVLMTSALAAVMETKDGGLAWFGETDQNKLAFEPVEMNINRFARMKEISRSESSLFNEHGIMNNTQSDSKNEIHETEMKEKLLTKDETDSSRHFIKEDSELKFSSLRRSTGVVSTGFKKGHSRSKSDQIGLMKIGDMALQQDETSGEKMSSSAPNSQVEENCPQDYYYQPEDGYMFPKPYKGQSLISYLNSRSYDTGAELDKENAHFSICEALITAIEQMKCSKFFDSDSDDSDEEIKLLKRKINERKVRKKLLKMEMQSAFSDKSTSTSQSTSSFFSGSTFSSSYSSSSADNRTPRDSLSQKTLSRSWENLSLSPHQNKVSKSPAMVASSPAEEQLEPDDFSAEFVAKSLLKKFDDRKLPAASDLKWMVTEEQVPQMLLPLPNAWPVSPDDALYHNRLAMKEEDKNAANSHKNSMHTRLRGNFEWAPPRAQIIFTSHPYVKRKVLLQKQHYRCAGCGLKVTPSLSKRFRYCEYLGKYFCTSCHQNRMSILPSKILNRWDFKPYPVSDFAYEFLRKIRHDPMFNISAIDNSIYKKIKPTDTTRDLRLKLHYAKGFLKTCRLSHSIYCNVEKLPSHLLDDIHIYSIEDLTQVKSGELQSNLKSLIQTSVRHINDCQLCKVKGFVCEYCRDGDDILYPFELQRVSTCELCKTCYHKSCFVPEKCPKCERIRASLMKTWKSFFVELCSAAFCTEWPILPPDKFCLEFLSLMAKIVERESN